MRSTLNTEAMTHYCLRQKQDIKNDKGKSMMHVAAVTGEKAHPKVTSNSEDIEFIAFTIDELCLAEGINQ